MAEKQKKEKKEKAEEKPKKEKGEQEDQGEVEAKSLPYSTDYAKTERAKCTGCGDKIPKGQCRMAIRTPSRFFEGLQDNWYHYECFWDGRARKGITDAAIRNFDNLKWEDQENIRERCKAWSSLPDDFGLPKSLTCKAEYAKSGRGKCHGCGEKIEQDAVRLHFRAAFFHPACVKQQGQFYDKAETIQNYGDLAEKDQKALDELFPGWSDEEIRATARFSTPPRTTRTKAQQKRLERIEKRKKKGGIVKGGLIVDPQFDQADQCHVYKDKSGKPWQFLVHHIDPQAGKKTFVKLQLVALDKDEDM
ncbi:hypothetical protein M3Y99_00246400 [Aphelenchoides fujianensis]|nr:hypothetical protein M3Y99_00246400 [Aphelenchoides fujianensis]